MDTAEPTYGATDIARMVGVDPATVYRAYRQQALAAVQQGARRSTRQQIVAWARANHRQVRAAAPDVADVGDDPDREAMRWLRARNATLEEELTTAQGENAALRKQLTAARRRAASHRAALLRYLRDEETAEAADS